MTSVKSEARCGISFCEIDSLGLSLREYMTRVMDSLLSELRAVVPCDERNVATRITLVQYNEVPVGLLVTKTLYYYKEKGAPIYPPLLKYWGEPNGLTRTHTTHLSRRLTAESPADNVRYLALTENGTKYTP